MTPDLTTLPGLDVQDGAPVFEAPWQAQAFALVVHLHERGAFEWSEWAAALGAEIHGPIARDYYEHWLVALEKLVAEKSLSSAADLSARKEAWQDAAARTPHGEPIEL